MPIIKDTDEVLSFEEAIAQAENEVPVVSTGHPHPTFTRKFNNYGQINLTEEEFRELQRYLTSDEATGRCKHTFFSDPDMGMRYAKAMMVNLYFEYEGDWGAMKRDSRCVSDATLGRYWQDEKFRACIMAYEDIFTLRAKSVVSSFMMNEGIPPAVRLRAAELWLQANDSKTWDSGVRKQIVANKGSLANSLFNKIATNDDVLKTLVKDPFSPLPDEIKQQLAISLAPQDPSLTQQLLPTIDATAIPEPTPDPFSVDDE